MSGEPVYEVPASTLEERNSAAAAHMAPFVGSLLPFFGSFVVTLVVWWLKRESVFVDQHARASINFQLSMTLYYGLGARLRVRLCGIRPGAAAGVGGIRDDLDGTGGAPGEGREVLPVPDVPAISEASEGWRTMKRELGYVGAAVAVSFLAVAPLDLHDFPLDPRLRPLFGVPGRGVDRHPVGRVSQGLEALAPVATLAELVVRCGGPGV